MDHEPMEPQELPTTALEHRALVQALKATIVRAQPIVAQFHSCSHRLRSNQAPLLNSFVAGVLRTRQLVDVGLLLVERVQSGSNVSEDESEAFQIESARAIKKCRQGEAQALAIFEECGIELPSHAQRGESLRDTMLRIEAEVLQALDGPQIDVLRKIVGELRAMETQTEFQTGIARDRKIFVDGGAFTWDNFSYGSTPFHTWLKLVRHPVVKERIAQLKTFSPGAPASSLSGSDGSASDTAESAQELVYTVMGSSCGWLLFYAALHLRVLTVGYEILPSLAAICISLVANHGLAGRVCVHNMNMIDGVLSNTGLLFLTSQCWEDELLVLVRAKIEAELPVGSLVVDYKDAILGSSPYFRLACQVSGEVSWNTHQEFFVFERICGAAVT